MVISYVLFLINLLILLYLPEEVSLSWIILPYVINGMAYSIYSPIIWSIIKFEIDERFIGMAFGIVFSIYNVLYIIELHIYGMIVDKYEGKRMGYYYAQLYLTITIGAGLILKIIFYFANSNTKKEDLSIITNN